MKNVSYSMAGNLYTKLYGPFCNVMSKHSINPSIPPIFDMWRGIFVSLNRIVK